ncbi:CRISPR-associated protein Cas4 [Alicyclobacillus mali (ex Roth et al. 2021)]|uniref:CRISPR-associated protein Cas4 n=1 Tax=Alicyclobacillus mali (ex Roth et al. 2021) TaxID=1123961 RepID=UPI0008347421|nr:CRISPR-associated protein Cas4 [Alicyclobacillus mali (ex Roth et al. 2021)]MCL6489066.1 CRISPR-associated protein Cas4 [Alicyclobacillus mali (ex Roth et al. 2021)]
MDGEWLIPISSIEHYAYCPRQCALIYVEQTFLHNDLTVNGRLLHQRVDEDHVFSARGRKVITGMRVWSEHLGLVGRCDAVEFDGEIPRPIEFKRGKTRRSRAHEIQLCAQALCLEEMFEVRIEEASIFHIHSHRRSRVILDDALRSTTLDVIARIREMVDSHELPPPVADRRCERCSLEPACLPRWSMRRSDRSFWKMIDQDLGGEASCRL